MAERDMVALLIENTKQGVCSRIRYEKADRASEVQWRVIEPRCWVEGLVATSIRALQHEPERGIRRFIPLRIVAVEPAECRLSLPDACRRFIDGIMHLRPPDRLLNEQRGGRTDAKPGWFQEYSTFVHDALLDMHVTEAEARRANAVVTRLQISTPQLRSVHAAVFAEYLIGCVADGIVSDEEDEQLEALASCLAALGWRPA